MNYTIALDICLTHRWLAFVQSYDTIRYDSVYLTCSKKLTGSQLSPPHGTNNKLKCETKNKTMSVIGPVQSRCHESSPVGKKKSGVGRICWKGRFWDYVSMSYRFWVIKWRDLEIWVRCHSWSLWMAPINRSRNECSYRRSTDADYIRRHQRR